MSGFTRGGPAGYHQLRFYVGGRQVPQDSPYYRVRSSARTVEVVAPPTFVRLAGVPRGMGETTRGRRSH